MRNQILDIWLSRTPDGSRILIDPPDAADAAQHQPVHAGDADRAADRDPSLESSHRLVVRRVHLQLRQALRHVHADDGTFGPAFAERAQTLGRHRLNFGASYQYSQYTQLDGRSLETAASGSSSAGHDHRPVVWQRHRGGSASAPQERDDRVLRDRRPERSRRARRRGAVSGNRDGLDVEGDHPRFLDAHGVARRRASSPTAPRRRTFSIAARRAASATSWYAAKSS
jgi:hypothetical protein